MSRSSVAASLSMAARSSVSGPSSEEQRCLRHRDEGGPVGIRIAPYPPHRSGRADFQHPALAANKAALTPPAQACENKIQGAVNNALNTNSTYLGPTTGPGKWLKK
jgi:hypothetical protein